jgi:hypothetical protein
VAFQQAEHLQWNVAMGYIDHSESGGRYQGIVWLALDSSVVDLVVVV